MRVVAYIRVSTEEQHESGLGLDDQRSRIMRDVSARGWELVELFSDTASGKDLRRPGLARALRALGAGSADALVVAKLDRLTRSLLDFAGLMERAREEGWAFVSLDLGVDTTTAAGELVANVIASVAQWERRMIGERTKAALAALRARGVRLGRPRTLTDKVVGRIVDDREAGLSLQAIADRLNEARTPTAQGGKRWYASTVRAVLQSVALDANAA